MQFMKIRIPTIIDISVPVEKYETLVREVEFNESLVLIGKNGSGKSTLGYFIVRSIKTDQAPAFQVSAQRVVTLDPVSDIPSANSARNSFLDRRDITPDREHIDFHVILKNLFAHEFERNAFYIRNSERNVGKTQLDIPPSPIDNLNKIWNKIFPNHFIDFVERQINSRKRGHIYAGRQLSDGERHALYLIGVCVVAPENSILMIDEPELHLHKSLISDLWNEIEDIRSDCKFIYITHDLDFAATRIKAKKIWVKEYIHPNHWFLDEVTESDVLPENLILELLGSYKNILFTESEGSGLDFKIYSQIFPDFTIIPRGGHTKVIESTKAVRANPNLFKINAFGLIDKDFRSDEEIQVLEKNKIFTIKVAEIENLMFVPEVMGIMAKHLDLKPSEVIDAATDKIISNLQNNLEEQVSFRTGKEISYLLKFYEEKSLGKDKLLKSMENLIKTIDISALYDRNLKLYKSIIENKDLSEALKFHNEIKGFRFEISKIFGLTKPRYEQLFLSLLYSDKKVEIINALKIYIPSIL